MKAHVLIAGMLLLASCSTPQKIELPPVRTAAVYEKCKDAAAIAYPVIESAARQTVDCKLSDGALTCAALPDPSDLNSQKRQEFHGACIRSLMANT